MRFRVLPVIAAVAALTLSVAACGEDEPSGGGSKSAGKVGVILPDTTSSTRYTEYDAPLLTKALKMFRERLLSDGALKPI